MSFSLLLNTAWSFNFTDFDQFQYAFTQEMVHERILTYLQNDKEVENYYSLTPNALTLFESLEAKKSGKAEYTLFLAETPKLTPYSRPPLNKAKIALDPGHFGGLYCKLEDRYIDITDGKFHYQFNEGTLTYLTAIHLKELLESAGAEVYITKEGIGKGALKESFFDWLKNKVELWGEDKNLKTLFRTYYNPLDLRQRANLINAFNPDITVIIHYNAEEVGEKGESNTKTTDLDYNLVFIPGAFGSRELTSQESRYEFLRLITTHDIENSLKLSQQIAEQLTQGLHIPLLTSEKSPQYIHKCCMEISHGVFSRNLALTRLVHSPLCYGESLIQNNAKECQRLADVDTVIDGVPCSSRIKEVAESYFKGIQNYFNH